MSLEVALFTGIGGCVTAIITLFGLEQKRHGETSERLKQAEIRLTECESRRLNLAADVGYLKGKSEACSGENCPFKTTK